MTYQSVRCQLFAFLAAIALLALGSFSIPAWGGCDIEGDFDDDCDVDFLDLSLFGQSWMTHPWEDGWNWAHFIKFSTDLRIDAEDLGQMSQNWLHGTAETVFSEVNLTPAGGHFELPGGIVIDAPAGAVDEDVSFEIRLVAAEEVEPYLDIGDLPKSFMGGVEIDCDGIAFNTPITLEFPVIPLAEPNSLAYLYYLNRQDGTLIPDLPDEAASPSQAAYAMLAETSAETTYMFDGRDAIVQMLLDILPPEQHTRMLNEIYDILGHSDCTANPCRCMGQKVVEKSSDYTSSSGCSKVSITGSLQYTDCEGSPTESWQMHEQSIQLGIRVTRDTGASGCNESWTMGVDVFGLDGSKQQGYAIKATSLRPDLLTIESYGGGLFLLEQVGSNAGTANVLIETDCNVKRTITLDVGCEIPDVTGWWTASASERWWDCQLPADNGTYSDTIDIEIDSQIESYFAGSWEFVESDPDYTMYYEEEIFGQLTQDCEISTGCTFKVSGNTTYTETYYIDGEDEPYIVEGADTFEGTYENGVIRLTTEGGDTSGDTCKTKGGMILRR